MKSAVAAFILAMLVTALCTPVVRRVALAIGAVDEPGARRVHTRHVPRMGGIAIVIGFFFPLALLFAARTHAARFLFSTSHVTSGLMAGSVLVVVAGVVDDLRGMGAKRKLSLQVLAAAIAYGCGMRIETIELPWLGSLALGWLGLPVTVGWIVGIVNAMNLIDGLDGLAAGVAFLACVVNFTIASLTGNFYILMVTASLGGAVIGFLFYNFNPAQIFMGDSGSMFLGFILACASLIGAGTQKSPTVIAIVVPILALGLPIMDMLFTIARRFIERRSIFAPDRRHIHHRLLDMGLTHRRAVVTLYMLSIVFTIAALVTYFGRTWQIGVALFTLTVVLVAVVRFVGYFSYAIVSTGPNMGTQVPVQLRHAISRALRLLGDARSLDELPGILSQFGDEGGLLAVSISNPKHERLDRWSWESPRTHGETREAECIALEASSGAETLELRFFFDPASGVPGLQMRALLQLVADGVTELLVNATGVARSSPTRRHGRPASQAGPTQARR